MKQTLSQITDEISDIEELLSGIDFDFPSEPSDDAPSGDWREYAEQVGDKLANAEKAVGKALSKIEH